MSPSNAYAISPKKKGAPVPGSAVSFQGQNLLLLIYPGIDAGGLTERGRPKVAIGPEVPVGPQVPVGP